MDLDTTDQSVEAEAPNDIRSAIVSAMEQSGPVDEGADTANFGADRPRGPDGKFISAATEPVEEDQAPLEAEAPAAPTTETEKPTEEVATGLTPPDNWPGADKELFNKQPPEAKEFLLRRYKEMEGDYTRKTMEVANLRREYEPVANMFAPHREMMAAAGHTPETLVRAWYDVERGLQEGRAIPIIKSLVDGYKVDRAQLAAALGLSGTGAPGTVAPPAPDGTAAAPLPPEVQNKLAQFDQFMQTQTQQQAAAQQRAQQEATTRVVSLIDNFKTAKDDKGNLLHPHFDAVEEHMARLTLAAKTRGEVIPPLDELYDQAVWANPSTRELAMSAKTAATEAQRQADAAKAAQEARAKAEKARRANSPVTGSPGLGQTPTGAPRKEGGTLADDIRAAMAMTQAA